jgi:hypothetical protein
MQSTNLSIEEKKQLLQEMIETDLKKMTQNEIVYYRVYPNDVIATHRVMIPINVWKNQE